MNGNRERFERELARGRAYDLFAVVVEATLAYVSRGRSRSEMQPHAALQSIIAFQVRYGVPFLWAGNRKGAEYCTYWLLAKYLREIRERYELAIKAKETPGGGRGRKKNRGDKRCKELYQKQERSQPHFRPRASAGEIVKRVMADLEAERRAFIGGGLKRRDDAAFGEKAETVRVITTLM